MLTKENLKSNRQKFYRYLYKNMSCCYLSLLNIMVIWFAYLIIDLVLESLQIVKNGKFFLKKKLKFTYFKTSKSRLWSWKYQNLSLAAYSLVLILLFSKKQTPASTHFPNFKAFLICIALKWNFITLPRTFSNGKNYNVKQLKILQWLLQTNGGVCLILLQITPVDSIFAHRLYILYFCCFYNS